MSAIDREKLLELIKSRKTKLAGSYKDIEYGAYMELETIEAYIESGAFDVREKEPQDTFSRAMLWELEKIEEYKRAKEDDGHE